MVIAIRLHPDLAKVGQNYSKKCEKKFIGIEKPKEAQSEKIALSLISKCDLTV